MAKGNETATFRVDLEGNAADKAAAAASAIQTLKTNVNGSQASIRQMSASLKNLSGDSDEVKAAQASLKTAIDEQKASLSSNTLEMMKAQKAYDGMSGDAKKLAAEKAKLADKTKGEKDNQKKLADEMKKSPADEAKEKTKALNAAISAGGGPVAALRDKLSSLKDIMGENGAGGASSLLTLGMAGLAAAAVAVVVGIAAAAVALGKFVLKGADAARSAGLLREAAFGGNAEWGKAFGEQVDALSKKVPTSKADLDQLGVSLARSKIGGQTWVDTMNAVAQANAALPGAGDQLKDFITRGQQFNRFQLNPQELKGTGIEFQEVATQLAKNMKVGVKDAQQALFEGRVSLGDGAAAMRAAVEAKFGKINLRQMLSLDNLGKKLGETFDALTKDVNLEPLLLGLKDLMSVFDTSTVSGQALKQMVTLFGGEMVKAGTGAAPLLKQAIFGMIIAGQEMMIGYLKLRNTLRDTFAGSSLGGIANMNTALALGKFAMYGIAAAAIAVTAAVALALAPVIAVVAALSKLNDISVSVGQSVRKTFLEIDWKATGLAIVQGIVSGLSAGPKMLIDATMNLANTVKDTFTGALKIHSPSKVFEEYGRNTTEGYAQGVDSGSDAAQSSVNAMVTRPNGSVGSASAAPISITVQIYATGSGGQQIAASVSDASVLDQITKAIVDAVHGSGAGVPA